MNLIMPDAATPPDGGFSGYQAVAGYLGGPSAARVWTDSDWQAQGNTPKLPIWVPELGAADAHARQEIMQILDRYLHLGIPAGQVIAFDLETSQAQYGYMAQMGQWLRRFGIGTIAYGSKSTLENAVPSYMWLWDADWTGQTHLSPGSQATQFVNLPDRDLSVISQELYDLMTWRAWGAA